MAPEITRLYEEITSHGEGKASLIGVSLDGVSETQRAALVAQAQIRFPVIGGEGLARKFQVAKLPTVIFVPRNLPQRPVKEAGYRRFFYLDEVRKLIQGM